MANYFYEWDIKKMPYLFRMKDQSTMALGGLYSYWKNTASGEKTPTTAVITTPSNKNTASIGHDRHPLVVQNKNISDWLDGGLPNEAVKELIRVFPANEMEYYPVSREVNSVKNDYPELIEPI